MLEAHHARIAWRGALISAMLSTVGWPLNALTELNLPGGRISPALWASLPSVLLVVALLVRRTRTTIREASLAYLATALIVGTGLWISSAQFAALAPHWEPFQAHKLGVLTVALLAPELWVGLFTIAVYSGSAELQWFLLDPDAKARAASGEPWAMIAYSLFAVVLLWQSVRRFRIERELVTAQRDAAALARLARLFLAIRDFANTPLQTIVSVTDLLSMKQPALRDDLASVRRAVERLAELNKLLEMHESHMNWRDGDESLDPELVLARAATLDG